MSEKMVSTAPLFAVIDLGSNSFHMLITRLVAGSVQTVDKVKRKVRLASGLNDKNELNDETIERGLNCLRFFAERLQDIPPENIKIVATATLRIAVNTDIFLQQAKTILGRPVNVLSGVEEANTIYLGVAHTSCCAQQRLVFDIGGASTEIIVGNGFDTQKVISLNMGCVTFNHLYFTDNLLNENNFEYAVNAAKSQLNPLLSNYQAFGWQSVLGGSGTMQALAEILRFNQQPTIITLAFLKDIKQLLIKCKRLDTIEIAGLPCDRKPVFASGVAILTALFETFSINELQLSNGALREGLLYELIPNMQTVSIRQSTVKSLITRFCIDEKQAERVSLQAKGLFDKFESASALPDTKSKSYAVDLLSVACQLHELGLGIGFKNHPQHGAYIIDNADLAGFDQAERCFLKMLVTLQKDAIESEQVRAQTMFNEDTTKYLLMMLRLAVIFSHRRQDDAIPNYEVRLDERNVSDINNTQTNVQNIILSLPQSFMQHSPLMMDELLQESDALKVLGFALVVEAS